MPKVAISVLVSLLATPLPGIAQHSIDGIPLGPVQQAALQASALPVTRSTTSQQSQPSSRSWAGRHPVWAGALIGAAAASTTAIVYSASSNCKFDGNSCALPLGVEAGFIGAGIGAVAGFIIGLARK